MRIPEEISRLNYDAYSTLEQGKTIGWEQAAADTIHAIERDDSPETEAKVAFVAEFVGKVVAHINEPVVFHETTNDFTRLQALIPDAKRPFEISASSEADKKPFIHTAYRSKPLQYSPVRIPGAREITFSNTREESGPFVYMGSGARAKEISPDRLYDRRSDSKNVAVGNTEIADLFANLRKENDAVFNDRLFGALFHIAYLADDFDIAIPVVPALHEETSKALATVYAERAYSDELAAFANTQIKALRKLSTRAAADLIDIEELRDKANAAHLQAHVPSLTRLRDHDTVTLGNLHSALHQAESIVKEELQQKESLVRQEKLIRAIAGGRA